MSNLEGMDMMKSLGIVKIAMNLGIEQLWKNLFANRSSDFIIQTKKPQSELIQFLGLRDKNGKLIHFGDILTDSRNNLLTPVCEIENGEHILFFKPVQHLDKKMHMGCKSTYSNTLEIVGNIYSEFSEVSDIKIELRLKNKMFCNPHSSKYCLVEQRYL